MNATLRDILPDVNAETLSQFQVFPEPDLSPQDKVSNDVKETFFDGGPLDIFEELSLPKVPFETLPPVIADFARSRAEVIGADPAGIVLGCLVTCAAAISDDFTIKPKKHDDWTQSPRLWGMIVGVPSATKTSALEEAFKPLRGFNAELAEEDRKLMAEYMIKKQIYDKLAKAYVNEAAKAQAEGTEVGPAPVAPEEPPQRCAWVDDTTIEKLSDILSDNPHGVLLFNDEIASFFGKMDAYRQNGASGDRAFWLQAYNGGSRRIDRVTRGTIHIKNCGMSILGSAQPSKLGEFLSKSTDDGLIQRFLIIHVRDCGVDKDVESDPSIVRRYRDLVTKLFNMSAPNDGGSFVLDAAARKIREEFINQAKEHERLAGENMLGSHLGKWRGLFVRLLLIWHMIEYGSTSEYPPREISGDTAERVRRFMLQFLWPHAFKTYVAPISTKELKHARIIGRGIVANKLNGILTTRDIHTKIRPARDISAADKLKAIELLQQSGWLNESIPNKSWSIDGAVHDGRFEHIAKEERDRRKRTAAIVAK